MGKMTGTGMGWRELYQYLVNLKTAPLENPTLAIKADHAAIRNSTECFYTIDGTIYTLADETDVDHGTGQKCIAAYWNVMVVSADTSLALDGTWGAGTTGWASEAEAIAHMPAIPASQCAIGYVTVQAHATNEWIAGTDEYTGGGTGDIATTTTCYNILDLNNRDLI